MTINNLQNITDIINKDVDAGVKQIEEHLASLDIIALEKLAQQMAIAVSMLPNFIEEE